MSRYAALDIGSNSIRMLAAEVSADGALRELASDREVVRLGTGVFREGKLSREAISLACEVLARMAQQYGRLDVMGVRAVGTAALRDAANQDEFLGKAKEILGTPVEVVSGLEEARLIQLGVQTRWPHANKRILIADIGGGSAELILGENGHMAEAFSKPLGAVRLTEMFVKSDPPDPRELARMQKYIQERLAGPAARFRSLKVDRLIATSATAAAAVCAVNNVRRTRRDSADKQRATAAQIRGLFRRLAESDQAGRAKITGIGPRRAEIIVPGIAVLREIMEHLSIASLYYSNAGLRDGIIADLAHRKVGHEQARMDADQRRVVRALARRYGIGGAHAGKVAELSAMLFQALRPLHKLPQAHGKVLEAAAHLYNIGHYVNEARHHRHSMYLVANSDLPGFEARERMMIANLCRYHRKSMPQPAHYPYQDLTLEDRRTVSFLTPLLRLAVALDQSQEQRVDRVEARILQEGVELYLYSQGDVDIEQWHAQQIAPVFQDLYALPLSVRQASS